MKYDKPLLAMLFGVLAVLPFELVTLFGVYIGLVPYDIFSSNSTLFVVQPSEIVGAFTAPLTGGLAGLVIYYMTKFVGVDYLIIKGGVIGMFTWAILHSILKMSGADIIMPYSPSGNLIFAFGAAFAGAIMGYLIKKYLLR